MFNSIFAIVAYSLSYLFIGFITYELFGQSKEYTTAFLVCFVGGSISADLLKLSKEIRRNNNKDK